MSWDYVEQKIKEALHLHRGNSTRARQQIISWAMDDPKLLRTLVKPHMVGITAHAVNRVMSGKRKPEPVPKAPESLPEGEKDTLGLDILKAIAKGGSVQFGQENYGPATGKKGVSQRHIDAINQIIKKSETK
ncbi:MAG: hypothetical protein AAF549_07450 [Pseudomonadota bacterium]